ERIRLVLANPSTLQVGLANLDPAPGQGGALGARRPFPGRYTGIIYVTVSAPRQALATVTVYIDVDTTLDPGAASAIVPAPDPEDVPTEQQTLDAMQHMSSTLDDVA